MTNVPSQNMSTRTGHKLSANQDLGLKVATPVGTVFGQLVFGWLGDVYGRKRICEYPLLLFHILPFHWEPLLTTCSL